MKKQSNIPLETKIVDLKIVVDVYLRNNRKQALLVHISERTQISHLNRAVSSFFKIPQESQVLMFRGKQLRDLASCKIENKAVIHVIDTRNITPLITVKIKKLHSDSFQFYSVESSELIGDFIANNIQQLQSEKPFLVYASKRLKNNRTFAEQLVQNQSQLTCLYQRRDQLKTNRIYKRQHSMLQDQTRQNQKKAAFQKYFSGLQEYLPQNNAHKTTHQYQPESMKKIKDCSSKDNIRDCINKVGVKQVQVASSETNLRKIKCSKSNSNESLLIDCTQKKIRQESIQGSIISEITSREQNIESRNEENCFFQCVLKGLTSEILPPHHIQQIHQVNRTQGELKKIAAQLEKWQEKTKLVRTGSKLTDSSLQAVELPLLRHVRDSQILDQTSYFSPLPPKNVAVQLQPIKQHLSQQKEQKEQVEKDLIVEVELGSSVKNRKQLSDAKVELESTSSQNKKINHPQSAIMIDISFGQDRGTASSSLSKQQKLSHDQEQIQSLQNLQIEKEFYSSKDFHSFTNLLETEIRASHGHQKLVQKQLIFRSEPFYFEPLDFCISMFYEELTRQSTHLE